MIEWKKLPRGTYRAVVNGIELDVWQHSDGWMWKALRQGEGYLMNGVGYSSLDTACEDAIKYAETLNPSTLLS